MVPEKPSIYSVNRYMSYSQPLTQEYISSNKYDKLAGTLFKKTQGMALTACFRIEETLQI